MPSYDASLARVLETLGSYAKERGPVSESSDLVGELGLSSIDVMEVIGLEPRTLYTSLHTNIPRRETAYGLGTDTHLDLSAAFHEYAVDWGPEKIDWYFDRRLVYSRPTPPDLHKPCYIIANVGVGRANVWGGAPDSSTHFPATMQVAYIKVWQRPQYIGP